MTTSSKPLTICQAIARQEGFGIPNGRATRNNNPGDVEYGNFAKACGATRIEVTGPHVEPRFAYFPDPATGFAAMKMLLAQHYQGMTILQMLNKYAPPVENNESAYLKDVLLWTGLTSSTIIDNYL
jgi:hypothetical protein